MKSQSHQPGFTRLIRRLAVSFFILASLCVYTSPATKVQGGTPENSNPPIQPQSTPPDWKLQGITWRVSTATDGSQANSYPSQDNAISADGRYVVFVSYASADPQLQALPVVFLSAKGQEAEIRTGMAARAEEYLLKPFTPAELSERVGELLQKYHK